MGFKCFKIINDPNLENNLCPLEPNAQKRKENDTENYTFYCN